MDTQPKIPTLKDSQKPQVKVRGLEAGVTLFDRLKQFKKKDLAFILAGLGTLFMAPLAEHFMMSPETGDGTLQQGWGKGNGSKGMFDGSGNNVYEPGTTGLAPGNAVGGGSDIITPLNVRDPSALVMGPGAAQQPPTNSVMPPVAPPTAVATHSDSDLKDALAASARGVGAAAHAAKALLPIPKIALAGSGGLRGLGVVSGGSSAVGGGPISSNGLASGKAANPGNFGGVTGAKGVTAAGRSQTGGGSGALDALKAAGDKAAGNFNHPSANAGLNDAANTAIPAGGGSVGGNGAGLPGGTDKATGGDQNKDGKNVGESLAFLKQKAIQEAQIALWAKEQEAGDNKLEALKIRNSFAESLASGLASTVNAQIACAINPAGSTCPTSASGTTYACQVTTPGANNATKIYPAGTVSTKGCSTAAGSKDGAPAASSSYFYDSSTGLMNLCNGTGYSPEAAKCTTSGGTDSATPKQPVNPKGTGDLPPVGSVGNLNSSPVKDLAAACVQLGLLAQQLQGVPKPTPELSNALTKIPLLIAQGKMLAEVSDDLGNSGATGTGGALTSSNACGANLTDIQINGTVPISAALNKIVGAGGSLTAANDGILARMEKLTPSVKDPPETDLGKLATDVGDGQKTGATGDIAAFAANVAIVQGAFKPDASLMTGDPLNVTALGPQLNTFFAGGQGATVAAGLTDAVTKIQTSAGVVGPIVDNMNKAANTDLTPVVKPLMDSVVGGQATIPALVKVNSALDNVGGAPGMKVPAPLTVALDPQAKADATTPTAMSGSLQTAATDINDSTKGAKALVQAYAGAPETGAACVGQPCKDAQTALNTASKDVSTVQADQTGINASIRTAATTAMGRLAGTPATAPTP